MKKFKQICLLFGLVNSAEQNQQAPGVQEIIDKFDMDTLHNDLQKDIQASMETEIEQMLEQKLKQRIDEALTKQVEDMMNEEKDAGKKWSDLRLYQKENWDQYNKLMLRERLTYILEELNQSDGNEILQEFWPELPNDAQQVDAFNVRFDRKHNTVQVVSIEQDIKSRPLYEWQADVDTGKISKTTRQSDGTHEKVLEQLVNPNALKHDIVTKNLDQSVQKINEFQTAEQLQQTEKSFIPQVEPKAVPIVVDQKVIPDQAQIPTDGKTDQPVILNPDWDDLEMQRDIAFKIMYFFIIFIVMTFGLLYLYYRMNKQAEEEEAARRGEKGFKNDHTFLDFLSGQIDEETAHSIVNPQARQLDGRFDFMIGQQAATLTNQKSIRIGERSRDAHRNDSFAGFGANNLEELNNNMYQH